MRKNNNKILITIAFIVVLIAFIVIGIVAVLKNGNNKEDEAQNAEIEESIDAVEPTETETEEKEVPAEVVAGNIYREGMQQAAESFKNECAEKFTGYKSDLARFSLIDIDRDEIPELIMHDIVGASAYYVGYSNGQITDKKVIYESDNDINNSTDISTYAALYMDKNLFIRYEIGSDEGSAETYFYNVDTESKDPVLITSLSYSKGLLGDELTYKDAGGNKISKEEYENVFKENLGEEDYKHFFLDDIMIADGEYDFRTETTWNSTPYAEHMTYEELVNALNNK